MPISVFGKHPIRVINLPSPGYTIKSLGDWNVPALDESVYLSILLKG